MQKKNSLFILAMVVIAIAFIMGYFFYYQINFNEPLSTAEMQALNYILMGLSVVIVLFIFLSIKLPDKKAKIFYRLQLLLLLSLWLQSINYLFNATVFTVNQLIHTLAIAFISFAFGTIIVSVWPQSFSYRKTGGEELEKTDNENKISWLKVALIIIIAIMAGFAIQVLVSSFIKTTENKPVLQNPYDQSSWQVYTNESQGYSFKIPSGWSLNNMSGNKSGDQLVSSPQAIQVNNGIAVPAPGEAMISINGNAKIGDNEPGDNFKSVDDVLQSRTKQLLGGDSSLIHIYGLNIGGYEGKELKHNGQMPFEDAVVLIGSRFYEITIRYGMADNYTTNLAKSPYYLTFHTFLTTFTFQQSKQ